MKTIEDNGEIGRTEKEIKIKEMQEKMINLSIKLQDLFVEYNKELVENTLKTEKDYIKNV